MPSRIVVATLGSLGDTYPYFAVATALKKRGHDVVITAQTRHREHIESLGIKFARLRPEPKPVSEELAKLAMDRWRGSETVLRDILLASVAETYEDLLAAAHNADLLVTHVLVLPAPLLARKTGIPWVSSALTPAYFLQAGNGKKHQEWLKPYRKLEADLGLPPGGDPVFSEQYSSERVLVLASKLLAQSQPHAAERTWMTKPRFLIPKLFGKQRPHWPVRQWITAAPKILSRLFASYPQPQWPSHVHFTGFPFFETEEVPVETARRLDDFLSAGSAPIVFTLGSSGGHMGGRFFTESVRAAKLLGRRALLITGGSSEPPRGEWDQGRDLAVFRYVPYNRVFRRSSAVVHSGGIGTTALALRAGRPMLVVPISHDQPDTAARVCHLGVARVIPHAYYEARWAAAELRAILENPKYARTASHLARQIQSEDGVRSACDAIEQHLARTRAHAFALGASG